MWNDRNEFFLKDGSINTTKATDAMRRARADAVRTGMAEIKRTLVPQRAPRKGWFW
ncbi:MAG: hypothetical protein AAGK37_01195 [Pseudomonadota bacterium]